MLRFKRKIKEGFYCLGLMGLTLLSTSAMAGIEAISGGVTYPTPLGFNFDTLTSSIGGEASLFTDVPWNSKVMMLQFTLNYEGYSLRNPVTNSVVMPMASAYASLMIMGGHTFSKGFTPFVSFGVGGAFTTLLLSGNTAAVSNIAISPATQIAPGFDLPLFQGFGLQLQMPFRQIYSKTMLLVFDTLFSVRVKL